MPNTRSWGPILNLAFRSAIVITSVPAIVAVPTTPHTLEQFEVAGVHQDGPSVVLHCQPLQATPQDEQSRFQQEPAKSPAARSRSSVHNDYEDLL